MIAVDHRQADAVVWGEGHAPVVAVLLAAAKNPWTDESIAAPKGHGPPAAVHFPCIAAVSWGPPRGAMIAFVDP
jgi:hypothetical protein